MRILIIEDEYYLAADLAEALVARGAEVIGPIGTLGEAMDAIAADPPDQAVLDMNLRGELSFPIADRLDAAGIPYVIATGYSAGSLPERFRGKPRVEKPFRPEQLAQLLMLPA
jgi:DNA-binding response OmpR family regulator